MTELTTAVQCICPICQRPVKIGNMVHRALLPDRNSASGESLQHVHLACHLGRLINEPSRLGECVDQEKTK